MEKNKWENIRFQHYALVAPNGEILAEVFKTCDFWQFGSRDFMELEQAQSAAEKAVSGSRQISVK